MQSLRQTLQQFALERDWDQYHQPRNIALALVGEVGELAECFQWKSDEQCPRGLGTWKEKHKVHLGEEISDVLLYLVRLADVCGVDLADAVSKKLAKNAEKYPADLVRGSSKKYNEYSGQKRSSADAELVDECSPKQSRSAATTSGEGVQTADSLKQERVSLANQLEQNSHQYEK